MNEKDVKLIRFMCGCVIEHDNDYAYQRDGEGFIVCEVHGQRRYGWRSFPDWSLAGYTHQQVETFLLYGLKPQPRPLVLRRLK